MARLIAINHDEDPVIGDDCADQNAQDGRYPVDIRLGRWFEPVEHESHPDMLILSDQPGRSEEGHEKETILGTFQRALYRFVEEIPHHDVGTDKHGNETHNDP